MESKQLPAFAIGLVDRDRILWTESFGNIGTPEDPKVPNVRTVYRVGSVSKLFTDIAVMRLVERGQIDLDEPVGTYLGNSFQPRNPTSDPITLRELMSHRSGLIREPPVGNYFDDSHPSLEATVESLSGLPLTYPPKTRTKYSNAGVAVVGYVLEKTQQQPFADYLQHDLLDPLGMLDSAFQPSPEIDESLAGAWMWTYEGRRFPAPTFQLGMAPAGSLYTTIPDLCRFIQVLLNQGAKEDFADFRLLQPSSLQEMWTPQFTDSETGYGLGFNIGRLEGERRLGHGGAIYGFATQLAFLPDSGLGVVTVANMDGANTVTSRVADHALRLLLAQKRGENLPAPRTTDPLSPDRFSELEGNYLSSDGEWTRIYPQQEQLMLERNGMRFPLRQEGSNVISDGRLGFGIRILPQQNGLELNGTSYERIGDPLPSPPPERWQGLIGAYGWDHDTLYILEKRGRLHALIEWFFEYPLEERSADVFAFPESGLYTGENLTFSRNAAGKATSVSLSGSVVFPRREEQPAGSTFKINPVKPIEELRQTALQAQPPEEEGTFREPDLIEPVRLAPDIHLDIRYATSNNFMGVPFYRQARAFLQRPAAEALVRAHEQLEKLGYGILIHDAYRPWYVTKMFWDATPEDKKVFVANPASGSRHNRGCAVDLTLYDLSTGRPVEMVSGYDEFSERAYPRFPGGTSRQRWHRELLRQAMTDEGFTVYSAEWWHFDYQDWDKYPILNRTFEELAP